IGLELGLANGRVACARDGKVEVVANEQGNRNTPACVAFTDEEQLLGEAAVSQQQRNARGTVVELRRLLGLAPDSAELSRWQPGWQFQLGEEGGDESASGVRVQLSVRGALKAYTPEFVASLLLKRLRSDAESYLNAPVKEAVLPLHAGTPPARAAALKRAALAAGLRATLVPSAIAVALG
ncbi:heat shock protein 70 family, partial [Pavlovales sp. CCMP2436]